MSDNNYKFDCDFYYLNFSKSVCNEHGIIYRHYLNGNIEAIKGISELEPRILKEDDTNKIEVINDKIRELKPLLTSNLDSLPKSIHQYMSIYNFNNTNYENYYKKISICHLREQDNICSTFDIDFSSPHIHIGMFFSFIKTSLFDIDNIKIKYKKPDTDISCDDNEEECENNCDLQGFTETDITFSDYKNCFQSGSYIDNCFQEKIRTGGANSITKIETEQKFIKHDTIMYYYTNTINDRMPVTIEYDYESNKYYIIDGNHRVAYHILKQFEYIPVIIIFKNLNIKEDTEPRSKKPRISIKPLPRLHQMAKKVMIAQKIINNLINP
jgi:hypothetical protein